MFRLTIAIGFLLLATACPAADEQRALLSDGTTLESPVTAVDADGRIRLGAGYQARTMAAEELLRWGAPADVPARPLVVLADGGILVADVLSGDREKLSVESGLLGTIAVAAEALSAVVFHPPSAVRPRDAFLDRAARGGGSSDRLLLVNGDEVTGLVETIGAERVRAQAELGPVTIETERIAAVLFRSAARPPAAGRGLRVWTGLRDGSRVPAVNLTLDSKSLAITLAAGLVLKGLPEDLVWLQPLGGEAVYVSDLKPADYRHVPYLSLTWPYRPDRSVQDRWLRCDQHTYLKGIGVHSAARLTYRLAEPYRRFGAFVGIDDETAGGGSVRFRVFVDGLQKYLSPVVRGGDAPLPVRVDIAGAKRIDLVVDFADRADELDHADWLDACLVR